MLGRRRQQGSKGLPPSEDHVHICFEKKYQVKRNSKCNFQSLASFNNGSPSCQWVILVANHSSVHYLVPFDKYSEPLYSVVGKSTFVKSPIFLGMMPQSLHVWIWGCSDNLLCRASRVLSAWMGPIVFAKLWFLVCLLKTLEVSYSSFFCCFFLNQDLFPSSVWMASLAIVFHYSDSCCFAPTLEWRLFIPPTPFFLLFLLFSPVILIHQLLLADLITSPEAKMAGWVISLWQAFC